MNPASAGGKTARHLGLIKDIIVSHICKTPKFMITAKPWDAALMTKKAIEQGASLLIVAGGDGTIQEVVNGYFDKNRMIGAKCPLGIINCGTGGGLAQSLRIPKSLISQFDVIKKGTEHKIDCGRVQYLDHKQHTHTRYFINELQFGIGGTVVNQTGILKKRLGGTLAFGLTTLKSVFTHPNQRLQIKVDYEKKLDGFFTGVVVANGAYTGGGMNLTPGAETDDGYFNILLINGLSVKDRLIAFSKIYSGKHIKNGKFSYFTAKNLSISSKEQVLVEADGELLGNLPCEVKIVPKSIPVLISN
jgi:YegS/Rv2252/BmrU family lipid kinase